MVGVPAPVVVAASAPVVIAGAASVVIAAASVAAAAAAAEVVGEFAELPGAVPLLKVVTDVRTTAAAAVAAAAVAAAAAAPAAVAAAVAAAGVAVGEPAVLAVAVAAHEVAAGVVARGRGSAIFALRAAGDALGAGLALAVVERLVVLDARALVELGGGTKGGWDRSEQDRIN